MRWIVHLRPIREERGLTPLEAAAAIGIAKQYLDNIERGDRIPSMVVATRIARFFKLPIERIWELEDDAKPRADQPLLPECE